ncbi:hypothetical protein [Chryseobacterium sp.]|uniref:hypothetical protein n=1 Tax=Chryseobacterium sp. TaxID=1871047 RepID=UPI00261FAA42|nr:hypothetical protein [Chryseobacterium sp.]
MKNNYLGAFTLCTILGSAQEILWQKDLKSSTLGFLSQDTTIIDEQLLISQTSTRTKSQQKSMKTKNKVTKMNTQALVQGAYLVTIKTDTSKTANAKLIKK